MGEEEQGESHFKSMQRGGDRRKEDYEIFLINKKYCMYKLCAIIQSSQVQSGRGPRSFREAGKQFSNGF